MIRTPLGSEKRDSCPAEPRGFELHEKRTAPPSQFTLVLDHEQFETIIPVSFETRQNFHRRIVPVRWIGIDDAPREVGRIHRIDKLECIHPMYDAPVRAKPAGCEIALEHTQRPYIPFDEVNPSGPPARRLDTDRARGGKEIDKERIANMRSDRIEYGRFGPLHRGTNIRLAGIAQNAPFERK
jgi:hypothetical protein